MKISTTPFPFADSAPQISSAKDTAGYGDVFEKAIRNAQKGLSSKLATREDTAAGDGAAPADDAVDDGKRPTAKRDGLSSLKVSANERGIDRLKDAATEAQDGLDDETPADAGQTEDAGQAPALALLGRLLGNVAAGDGKAGVGAEPLPANATADETVLEERVVVVSLQPGATEESIAGGTRGKVTLEVLRMETHFEPRSEAVVLVEGEAQTAAARIETASVGKSAVAVLAGLETAKSGQENKARSAVTSEVRLSFDEALARLGKEPARTEAAPVAGPKGDAVSDAGRKDGALAEFPGKGVADDRSQTGSDRREGRGSAEDRSAARARTIDERVPPRAAASLSTRLEPDALPLASMTDQVASRIIDTLGSGSAAARGADRPAGESILRFTAGGAALKTLTIQLQPENLGVLDVSMRLVEGQLTLELAASEASTAKVLAEDQEGLRKLLLHAGFSMDEASITIVTRDSSADGRIDMSSGTSAARQDGGSASGGGASGNGTGAGTDEREARRPDDGRQQGESGRQARREQDDARRSRQKSASTYI